jgi:hypothetical protein
MSDTQITPEQVTQPAETSISQSIDIAALNEEIQRESSFVDLINNIGFSCVNNRQHNIGNLYKTANNLSKALYKVL